MKNGWFSLWMVGANGARTFVGFLYAPGSVVAGQHVAGELIARAAASALSTQGAPAGLAGDYEFEATHGSGFGGHHPHARASAT